MVLGCDGGTEETLEQFEATDEGRKLDTLLLDGVDDGKTDLVVVLPR